MNKNIKKITWLLIVSGILFGAYLLRHHYPDSINEKIFSIKSFFSCQQEDEWITVFVHGSFGSLLGLLSASNVIKDDVKGTLYKTVTKKMRKDLFFYKDQTIQEKGLVKIEPTFRMNEKNAGRAVFPLTKSYDLIDKYVDSYPVENGFYTFGWSGLMSQQRRRLEGLRLYNALSEELIRLRHLGKNPKIRIIAHSHGGNIVLNVGAVHKAMNMMHVSKEKFLAMHTDEREAIFDMIKTIKDLPKKEDISVIKGQKRFDYIPQTETIVIDEFVLYGVPIQPETEWFCLSPVFKHIYNIYSEEDYVQGLDFFTTKSFFSNKRIKKEIIDQAQSSSKIAQIRIMYGRDKSGIQSEAALKTAAIVEKKEVSSEPFWKQIFTHGSGAKRSSFDPTHKGMWYIDWKEEESSDESFDLCPLPTVLLTPAFLSLVNNAHESNDIDINVSVEDDNYKIALFAYQDDKEKDSLRIPVEFIQNIKEKINEWKPEEQSDAFSFQKVYNHLIK